MSFKIDNWAPGCDRRLLVTIALTDPEPADGKRDSVYTTNPGATPTLYLCDQVDAVGGVFTYGGDNYAPLIMGYQGNSASVDFRGGNSDADAMLTMVNCRYPFQKKHSGGGTETNEYDVKLSQLMADYLWSGATITVTVYCKTGAGVETTQGCFKSGRVFQPEATPYEVTLKIIHDKKPIRSKPDAEGPGSGSFPSVITRDAYPKAPDDSLGQVLPLVYNGTNGISALEDVGGLCVNPKNLLGLWKPVPTDVRYDGTYLGRFVAGAYPTQTAPATGNMRLFYQLSEINTFAVMKSTDINLLSSATEVYGEIVPNATADLYLNPNDFVAKSGANVTNPGQAFDGFDTTYASVASTGASETLDLRIPYVGPYGRITGSHAWILLAAGTGAGAGDATVNGTFGMWNANTGAYHFTISKNITKADARDGGFLKVDLTNTTYEAPDWSSWRWEGHTGGGVRQDIYWRVNITLNGCTAKVIACGLRITYIPAGIRSFVNRELGGFFGDILRGQKF